MLGIRAASALVGVLALSTLLSGCETLSPRHPVDAQQSLAMAPALLPEANLVDVWIEVFEPGPVPTDDRETQSITTDIRKAESRYIPAHLKNTLQKSGYWGAVRVVPRDSTTGEVLVKGRILESDGETLVLHIQALDSRGEPWLDKTYRGEAQIGDYDATDGSDRDAFQPVYDSIANDLSRYKQGLTQETLRAIRQVAELRFAVELAPGVFGDYLSSAQGRYFARRLPAEEDPMLRRVRTIRERDYLLIDTIDAHYDGYYRDIRAPYDNWRRFRVEEAANLRKVENQALTRKILGIGAIVGAIALEMAGGRSARASTSSLRSAMLIGGLLAAKSGFDMDSEAQIHSDAIKELDASFESEATPLVVDVEGETHRLTGSAEEQYAKWQVLLHRIYATETGLPESAGRAQPPKSLMPGGAKKTLR